MYRSNTCGELRLSDAGKEVTHFAVEFGNYSDDQ